MLGDTLQIHQVYLAKLAQTQKKKNALPYKCLILEIVNAIEVYLCLIATNTNIF